MQLLHKMSEFGASESDMKDIYIKFIRSILEYSCVVWGSSLTQENIQDLERVQKVAVKICLGNKYKTYRQSLLHLNLDCLEKRRQLLALSFAKSTLKTEYGTIMFPEKSKTFSDLRKPQKYQTTKCSTV